MVFDASCRNTFKEAGYIIDPFIVDSQKDIQRALKRSHEIAMLQHEQWYKDYKAQLRKQLKKAVENHIGKGVYRGS
jgi:hypothetical protein